jgi:Ca2+-binding EF-hand superfamily protein
MKSILLGGAAVLSLTAAAAAFAQAVPAAQPGHRPHARMTQTELRTDVQGHVAKMFGKLDANKDGFVTQAEVDAIQTRREAKVEQRAARFDPAKMFARLDTNKDGKITQAEADAAQAARAQAKGKPATAHTSSGLFARLDSNKDGVVTKAEFDAAAAQMHARIEQAGARRGVRADHMLATADANKDGKVSQAEMQQMALQHFDAADLNHDGKLTPDERKQARPAGKARGKA